MLEPTKKKKSSRGRSRKTTAGQTAAAKPAKASTSSPSSTATTRRKAAPRKRSSTPKKKTAAPAKTATPATDATPSRSVGRTISAEERHRMVAETAFMKAQARGFRDGSPQEDWFDAETEVDQRLAEMELEVERDA